MKEPEWVLPETVLALQERLLAEFGGLTLNTAQAQAGLYCNSLDERSRRPLRC